MAHELMSAVEFTKATYCYSTHTGEKVCYDIVSRKVKMVRGCGGVADIPMIKIKKRDSSDSGEWYRMNALFFVMPDGQIKR